MKEHKIEYEIPPLRAIYTGVVEGCESRTAVREFIHKEHPAWNIRKISANKQPSKAAKRNKGGKG